MMSLIYFCKDECGLDPLNEFWLVVGLNFLKNFGRNIFLYYI